MSTDAYISIVVVGISVALLMTGRFATDLVFSAALSALILLDILPIKEALSGFSNEGMITVAVLYVVVAGLEETGSIRWLVQRLLGLPKSFLGAQFRLLVPVVVLSAFLNNTPVVAMLMPAVTDWCKKLRISPSKLFLPLSYAAILGGTCTLIGTSTNLIVNGLMVDAGYSSLGIFDIAVIGVPSAILGLLYIFWRSRYLPERQAVIQQLQNVREYALEMLVEPSSPLVGKSIEAAGLRHLPQAYLIEIEREDYVIAAVSPSEYLKAGDRLIFVGAIDAIVDLQKIKGLVPATDQIFKLDIPRPERSLIEAVISGSSPIIGQNVRESRFRHRYGAVIIAIARGGKRIDGKIGDVSLQAGDILLLESHPHFAEQHRNSRDFLLLRKIDDSNPPKYDRAWVSLVILLLM
ncbi:MAG: SLC13 family permease, partial [Deinococcales bacterium]